VVQVALEGQGAKMDGLELSGKIGSFGLQANTKPQAVE